jgi:hypothetical protein
MDGRVCVLQLTVVLLFVDGFEAVNQLMFYFNKK